MAPEKSAARGPLDQLRSLQQLFCCRNNLENQRDSLTLVDLAVNCPYELNWSQYVGVG